MLVGTAKCNLDEDEPKLLIFLKKKNLFLCRLILHILVVDFITDTAVVFDILINETLHVFYFMFFYKCNCCLMNVK